MGADYNIYEALINRARYALNSRSLNLVYETYGAAKMAGDMGAISKEQMAELNRMLVREGMNNPAAGLE